MRTAARSQQPRLGIGPGPRAGERVKTMWRIHTTGATRLKNHQTHPVRRHRWTKPHRGAGSHAISLTPQEQWGAGARVGEVQVQGQGHQRRTAGPGDLVQRPTYAEIPRLRSRHTRPGPCACAQSSPGRWPSTQHRNHTKSAPHTSNFSHGCTAKAHRDTRPERRGPPLAESRGTAAPAAASPQPHAGAPAGAPARYEPKLGLLGAQCCCFPWRGLVSSPTQVTQKPQVNQSDLRTETFSAGLGGKEPAVSPAAQRAGLQWSPP